MKKNTIHLLFCLICLSLLNNCEPVVPQNTQPNKPLIFDNHDYESYVGNVNLLPTINNNPNPLGNPVVVLDQQEGLQLNFDILKEETEYYSAKLVHCNKDWKKSRLQDLEFLDGLNIFRINQSENSFNTISKYVNYTIDVPTPSISGNYLVVVHSRSNPNHIILSRRFVVIENLAVVNTLAKRSNSVSNRKTMQQIEVSVNYGNLPVNRPMEDISITVLQNHNWYSAISGVSPTMVRPNENYLEYRPIDLSLSFPGWNEFRFLDLRTVDQSGRNIHKLRRYEHKITASVIPSKSRGLKPYSLGFQDINGRKIIENNDVGRLQLSSDYVDLTFTLETTKINGDVYVIGRFNDWLVNDENKMKFIPEIGYTTQLKLKQGFYEYHYLVNSKEVPPYFYEGTFFETENDYEVFVYYREPGTINDRVIGYRSFKSNTN